MLLKKLEDGKEGLMGITEDDKRVHLGIPTTMWNDVVDFGYSSFEQARKVFSPNFVEELQQRKRKEHVEEMLARFRKDKEGYYYAGDLEFALKYGGSIVPSFSNSSSRYSNAQAYLRFSTKKEEAFQAGSPSYYEEAYTRMHVGIHREDDKR